MTTIDELQTRPGADPVTGHGGEPSRRRAPWLSPRLPVRMLVFATSVAGLYVAWVVGSHHFATYILPGPSPVWASFRDAVNRGAWATNVEATLGHMFLAFGITIA